jgi:phytoene desaturase (3,4-didehydrolycopene-forming)
VCGHPLTPPCSNVLAFRPKTKHATYKDCYFVGASTHPGTGVPICLAGAKITSEQILADRGQTAPWPRWRPGAEPATASALDVQRPEQAPWVKPLLALLAALFVFLAMSGRGPALLPIKL